MTIQEMHNLFDYIQDKYASAYFTDDEKDTILNRAQQEVVEDFLPDNTHGVVTPEQSSIIYENIDDLVYEIDGLSTSSGGLTKATIQTALNTLSGNIEPWLVILNSTHDGNSCKFVRHNDWYKFQENSFKSASQRYPQYKITSDKLLFLPATDSIDVTLTLLKRPIDMELGATESELPDRLHNKIVAAGIEIAGLASRDEALMVSEKILK